MEEYNCLCDCNLIAGVIDWAAALAWWQALILAGVVLGTMATIGTITFFLFRDM